MFYIDRVKIRYIIYTVLGILFSLLQVLMLVMATQMKFKTDDVPFFIGQLIGLFFWLSLAFISFRAAWRVKKKMECKKRPQ